MSSDDSSGSQYAMADIEYPGSTDVLCGRGGHAISHSGNVSFRMLVEKFKDKYINSNRYEKARVTAEVVRIWRNQTPPGRFLILSDPSKGDNENESRWHDIGDLAASKKVAQALRERNPKTEYAAGADPNNIPPASPPVATAVASMPSVAAVAAAPMPYAAPVSSSEWNQRKQRKQAAEPARKGAVAHQHAQHPKHQTQKQWQKQQNAFKKQVQRQVEQAEQEVLLAQQTVNQQAQCLQNVLMQRAQQETAAAAAQVMLNQMAIHQAQQQILVQAHQRQQQQQQAAQQQAVQQQLQLQQQQMQQLQQQAQQSLQQMQQPRRQDSQGAQDSLSDTSTLDSDLLWADAQGDSDDPMTGTASLDGMARSMPSAARLIQNVFDNEPTNGSSDSSTATSESTHKLTKMLLSQIDSWSDGTASEISNNDDDAINNLKDDTGAISDGSNSIAKYNEYPD